MLLDFSDRTRIVDKPLAALSVLGYEAQIYLPSYFFALTFKVVHAPPIRRRISHQVGRVKKFNHIFVPVLLT